MDSGSFGAGVLSERFDEALTLASRLHRNQTRKNGDVPYISHLLRVAGTALDYGASEDVAIAALLHDAVEDCGGLKMLEEIRSRFGDAVAETVLETSDSTTEDPTKKNPWKERKDAYLRRLRTGSLEAALISGCDKLDNATALTRTLKQGNFEILSKFKKGSAGLLWYFDSVVSILRERELPIAEELETELNRLKETLKLVDDSLKIK